MAEERLSVGRAELERSLLFRGVNLEPFRELLHDSSLRVLNPGEVLISPGEANHFLYLLLTGRLRVHLGKLELAPVSLVEPGEVVGELSLIDGQPVSAFVVADQECRLLVLHKRVFWSLIEGSHDVTRNLLFILSRRLRQGNTTIEASLAETVSEQELEEFELREEVEPEILADDQEESDEEALRIYQEAIDYVADSIKAIRSGGDLDLEPGRRSVERMIESLSRNQGLLLLATERRQEFAVSAHSVNVAVLGLKIAETLGYDAEGRSRVALAGLLHEIGVAWLPERLRNQPGQVSPQVRQRPLYAAEILEQACPDCGWLSETVQQVYERENGSGFPRGLEGPKIREEAKILGIADVFEACIHDRPHRRALTGYQLVQELTASKSKGFSDHLIKALIRTFSPYPCNEYVVLNTREVGRVVKVNPGNLLRPVVKVLYDSNGTPRQEPKRLDLSRSLSIWIDRAVPYHSLPE